MKKPLVSLVLVVLMASTSQAAWAGNYHNKAKLVRPLSTTIERVRNAQAYVAPPSIGAPPFANEANATPKSHATIGREVTAPSWSAACMTDQGPSNCGEPMWVYGNPTAVSRYSGAF
jgi:hypothetical protein